MTLSPVFRSREAVALLEQQGVWARLAPDMGAQADAVRAVYGDLDVVLGAEFRTRAKHVPGAAEISTAAGLEFLQDYFFLILFRSIFGSLGVGRDRLRTYTELNFCIKGTITAADNLFDDQAKSLLPLDERAGARFMSILQLMAFERLGRRVLDRGEAAGALTAAERDRVQRGLLDRMARIGTLEGSEEGGVGDVPTPEEMIEGVHRVRGGALFALAFVAPSVLEEGEVARRLAEAEIAVAQLGTAFQIVDDLTDFEFDLGRRSHNLLVSQVHHCGTADERATLERLGADGDGPHGDLVEQHFKESARVVLERAYAEARASFRGLQALGFWLEPELAEDVVHAIVGLDGTRRMEALTSPS
ncbi:MAG: class 1 isoprenoid biosynthesis enzyme [Gemmatimonadetes bacterium]|nr:class 1 isoprenoid biosynthesis enzyme [Gemmatimonadota bacterium]